MEQIYYYQRVFTGIMGKFWGRLVAMQDKFLKKHLRTVKMGHKCISAGKHMLVVMRPGFNSWHYKKVKSGQNGKSCFIYMYFLHTSFFTRRKAKFVLRPIFMKYVLSHK